MRKPTIIISAHARKRWFQRVAKQLKLRDIHGVTRSAWERGSPRKPPKGSKRHKTGIRKHYMGYIFVFDEVSTHQIKLVTIINPIRRVRRR